MCTVSRHAEALLESDAPASLEAALEVLSYLKASEATLTKDEDSHPFTECATFADNIKGQGYSFQSGWHFIDQPLTPEGQSIEDFPDFVADSVDVLEALEALTSFLKGESVTSPNTYIDQIQSSFADEKDQLSFALRLVIHYVGDIHQPLHAVAGVSDEYPKGDRGGNSEWIDPSVDGVGNLHQVWDSVIYSYIGYETLVRLRSGLRSLAGSRRTNATFCWARLFLPAQECPLTVNVCLASERLGLGSLHQRGRRARKDIPS